MDLVVQIVRFVQEHQPPVVACDFEDADGNCHTLIDKVLIFSNEWLTADSEYPQPGTVRCEVLDRWQDIDGQDVARITTNRPDHVESTKGISEFVVLYSQLSGVSSNPNAE